jgi:predicted AlkP superfamily pyrophosphatase or phosphodiesterase
VRYSYLLLLLVGTLQLRAQPARPSYVLMVSFDGFRYDYVETFQLPNFQAFIRSGAAAEGLIPSFPSKTFPNHYTLVTGLYPGHHGLVDNAFYDRALDVRYGMRDRERVENAVFYGGTPLWQLAQQQGLKSASYFWVGSEAPVQGQYPTYYLRYEEEVPNRNRINQVIDWLSLPKEERPHFITLYFSLVDTEGHNTGTQSEALKQTLTEADQLLGYLMEAIKNINLPVNVILVSDHGMLELPQEEKTYITLSEIMDVKRSSVSLVNGGTQVHLYTDNVDSVYTALKRVARNFSVYRKTDMPGHWHYTHDRVGDVLLTADPGFYFQVNARNLTNVKFPVFGVHGYDAYQVKEMNGIFYASGPNIKPGATVKAFENVHVYPFVARLLGLKSPATDGNAQILKSIYKK